MFRTDIFKSAGQEIIEYFFDQIYDLLASEDPQIINANTQEIKKCRVKIICDEEIVYPLGKYSMAPILRASNTK